MMRSLLLMILTLPTLFCVSPRAAHAASPYQRTIDAAHTAFEVGDYAKAIARFKAAYALKRDPRLLYNLALSYTKRYRLHRQAADRLQAQDLFRRFLLLASSKGLPPPKQRQLRQMRRLAQEYLAGLAREKGGAAATLPTLTSMPASMPTSQPSPAASAPAVATTIPNLAGKSRRSASRWPWALYALAAAGTTAAAITGGLALNAESEAEQLARAGDLAGNHREADAAERFAVATDVLIGVAVVSAVVGVIWHWRTKGR